MAIFTAPADGCFEGSPDLGASIFPQDMSSTSVDPTAERPDMAYHPHLYDDMTVIYDLSPLDLSRPSPPADMVHTLTACPVETGLQRGSPWPMPGHDSAHTSRSPFVGPAGFRLLATVAVTPSLTSTDGTLAVAADGTVYAATADGLFAYSPTLAKKWSVLTPGLQASAPLVLNDGAVVFVASNDNGQGRTYAVAADGTVTWTSDTDVPYASTNGTSMLTPAISCEGLILTVADGRHSGGTTKTFPRVTALRIDGTQAWSFDSEWDAGLGARRAASGRIYLGATVLAGDGSRLFDMQGCGWVDTVTANGIAVDGPSGCGLDGELAWSDNGRYGGYYALGVATGSDGTLFYSGVHPAAINSDTGAIVWMASPVLPYADSSPSSSGPVLDGNGILYFLLTDGGAGQLPNQQPQMKLFAMDTTTGTVKWSYDLPTYCTPTGIALGTGNRLYVACGDLFAFGSTP